MLVTAVTSTHFRSLFCIQQSACLTHLQTYTSLAPIAASCPPFCIGDQSIEFVSQFTYLGCVLSADDSDDQAAYARLQKTARIWGRFKALLQRDGASTFTLGQFYRTIIMQTLLFGSETWTLSTCALAQLERFHARCARGIAHWPIQHRADGTWEHPPTAVVLAAVIFILLVNTFKDDITQGINIMQQIILPHINIAAVQCLNLLVSLPGGHLI
jgi:hypothetical protein